MTESKAFILIVDDDETCRMAFAGYLGHAGYRTLTAPDGPAALELLGKRKPDLILVDALMPEMDGYELVQTIRSDPNLSSLPIIMCSGAFAENEATELAYRCGINRFVTKMSAADVLVETVERVLEESTQSNVPGGDVTFDSDHKQLLRRTLREKVGALEQSEARLRLLVGSVKDYGLVLIDREGLILSWNPGAETITGLSEHDAHGQPFSCLLGRPAGADAEARAILKEASQSGRHEVSGWRHYSPGDRRWIELVVTEINESDGRLCGFAVVLRDLTTQRRFHEERENLLDQLRALTHRFEQVREQERARIARDLHDDLGQSLTALSMDLANLEGQLPSGAAELATQCHTMQRLIDHTVETVQHIASELRLGHLDELGLGPAIEWQLQEFQRRSGIACEIVQLDEPSGLDEARATAVYRILQEALTNVARHSKATQARLRLGAAGDVLFLELTDNGRGITVEQINDKASIGLAGMKERARAWQGDVEVQPDPSGGTIVKLSLPINGAPEQSGYASK